MRSSKIIFQATAAVVLAAGLGGCASIQAPLPPALELPRPPNDLRAVRKGDRVYLFWSVPTQTMDHQSVRRPGPTRVCRSLQWPMDSCGTAVGNVPLVASSEGTKPGTNAARVEATFVDTLPRELQEQNPDRMVTYAVESLNREMHSAGLSNRAQVGLAPTLAAPANFSAAVTAAGVVLKWDWQAPSAVLTNVGYQCRIYRKSLDKGSEARLADVDCGSGEFHDTSAEWEKKYEYRIATVTSVKREGSGACAAKSGETSSAECSNVEMVEGDDSLPQEVFTKDIYPPAVPSGLQAVFSGPEQAPFVDLLWTPDTDADLAGYNVYRREAGGQAAKINSGLVKTPAFRDLNVAAGKTYWYSVSAVDERGNESGRSEEASEAVPVP